MHPPLSTFGESAYPSCDEVIAGFKAEYSYFHCLQTVLTTLDIRGTVLWWIQVTVVKDTTP